ncbi:hypothetical protein B0G74_1526 [Paraburkholderia sp. BL9I2N2]|jgi:hypothetical protein|nr:hypothetical protein B0G74_1526 [Paraburkholderia sp. BL9I2N2]
MRRIIARLPRQMEKSPNPIALNIIMSEMAGVTSVTEHRMGRRFHAPNRSITKSMKLVSLGVARRSRGYNRWTGAPSGR